LTPSAGWGLPACTEGTAHNTQRIFLVGIDRPRSFRDDR
jgi:hypothetical protein